MLPFTVSQMVLSHLCHYVLVIVRNKIQKGNKTHPFEDHLKIEVSYYILVFPAYHKPIIPKEKHYLEVLEKWSA